MDLTVVQYLLFILVSLILIWVAIEFNKRLSRRPRSRTEALNWVELDTKHPEAKEKKLSQDIDLDSEEEEEIEELHARARLNGYHAESQRPQL